ncbi:hypothetical protein DL96DRAFT_1550164 [Flagelloscypha sp. PMI_526]|nr:hypothetical protein DL96DRAFT_1550164 [Flagelloscypha sp. PMI_526]
MVKLLSLVAALPLVLAVPRPMVNVLPRGAVSVAVDEDNSRFIAFDHEGKELGTYSMDAKLHTKRAGTCTPMQQDDIGKLPGIGKLRDQANAWWGKGSRREVVNDSGLTDSPANVCSDDDGVNIVYDGTPSCQTITNEAEGTLEGGSITLSNSEGVSMSTTTEVTKQASLAVGSSVSVGFKFPEIGNLTDLPWYTDVLTHLPTADLSATITTTSTMTNTQGHSATVAVDQRTTQTISQPVDEGQTQCKVILTSKTCNIVGKGFLKDDCFCKRVNGHYKALQNGKLIHLMQWGIVMESILNEEERASTIDFKSSGQISSSGHFSSTGCTKGETVTSS